MKRKVKHMSKAEILDLAKKLPPLEREKLGVEIFRTLANDMVEVPDWHWPLIEEALEEYRRNPKSGITFESVEEFFAYLDKSDK